MLAAPRVVVGDVVGHRSKLERVNRRRLLGKENVLGATNGGSLVSQQAHAAVLVAARVAVHCEERRRCTVRSEIVHSLRRMRPKKAQVEVAAAQRSPSRRR
jgi:hypothetical protein